MRVCDGCRYALLQMLDLCVLRVVLRHLSFVIWEACLFQNLRSIAFLCCDTYLAGVDSEHSQLCYIDRLFTMGLVL